MTSSPAPRRRRRSRLFRFESLEARRLLTADTFTAEPLDEAPPTAAETRVFYVNDAAVNTSGDWTTAPGDNAQDGLTPDAPMASIEAVFQTYELGPGDVILVDAGNYLLSDALVLDAQQSGVTIRGYADAGHLDRAAIIDRGNAAWGNPVIELAGAEGVTIENLTLTGGAYGIYAREAAGSHRLTVRGTTLSGNTTGGLWLERGNDHVLVVDNRVTAALPTSTNAHSHGVVINATHASVNGNTIYAPSGTGLAISSESVVANNEVHGSRLGITAQGANTQVLNNTVHGNENGIEASTSVLIADNQIYNNHMHGINGGGTIRNNVIHANDVGIKSRGHVTDNQIYGNRIGITWIDVNSNVIVEGNHIYANELGIEIANGRAEHNLIYANHQAGVRVISNSVRLQGNTIVQPTGNAVEVHGQRLSLTNNILSATNGYPLVVAGAGTSGLVSDYNLFHAGDSRPVALVGEHEIVDLETWIYELGLDHHSISGDPRFINPAGPDGVLGYDPATGVDGGQDDDFRLLPNSPAIDAGAPSSPFLEEPQPNGGRVNLGAYGNTALATSGPSQAIQVLEPIGLEKVTVGKETLVTWRTEGLTTEQPVALISVGSVAVEHWSADDYRVGTDLWVPQTSETVAIDQAIAPAPEIVYRTYRLGEQLKYHLPVSDGQYTLRLHFQEPLLHASIGSRQFDVILQGETVQENFDILANAGAPQTAVVADFTLLASNGQGIELELLSQTNWPAALSGIEFLQVNPQATPSPTVDIELSIDGGHTWSTLASEVPLDHQGRGSYTWTPQEPTLGNSALIRIQTSSDNLLSSTSLRPFQIAPAGDVYYVNDANTTDDQFTTAAGNHAHSGKSPDQPMANLATLLRSYALDAGDMIYVDAGTYTLHSDAVVQAQHTGITIRGADSAPAILTRDHIPDSRVIRLHQADDVTIEGLTLRGGQVGLEIDSSKRASIRGNIVLESDSTGIQLWRDSPDVVIEDNQVDGQIESSSTTIRYGIRLWSPDARVFGNTVRGFDDTGAFGIETATGTGAIIRDNLIYENRIGIYGGNTNVIIQGNEVHSNSTGIEYFHWTNIVDNHVYNNHIGIDAEGEVRGNTVHSNHWGIYSSGYIIDNHVYDNTIGVVTGKYGYSQAVNNRIYSNQVGIEASNGLLENNLVYANAELAIHLTGPNVQVRNNTIHQPVGDGVAISQRGAQLYNNIISVGEGTALIVSEPGTEGLQSNFNLIHLGFHPNAQAAFWNGQTQHTLADWIAASGFDARSLQADPMFVDPASTDGVLGYDAAADFDGGSDDDFHLQPHSPAIDRGHSWYGAEVDRDGNRPRADSGVTPEGSLDYVAEPAEASVFDGGPIGESQGWRGVNQRWGLPLPFAFPFYDASHTYVFVSSNGYLEFQPLPQTDAPEDREKRLPLAVMIAPLWADLRTDGEGNDIFVYRSSAHDFITIRWQATHPTDGSAVNFAVTLYNNGHIRFDYGDGNQSLDPVIGVSRGDGSRYYLPPYNGAANLANAPSLMLSLAAGFADIGAYEFQGDSPQPAPPRAVFDVIRTTRNTAVTVDVLANDLSAVGLDREQLQVLAVSSDNVAITVVEGGRLHIEPRNGFIGTAVFQYQITDTAGRTSHPVTSLIQVQAQLGQNPRDPADVLDQGAPSPLGALSILNTIRRYRSGGLSEVNVDQLHASGAITVENGPFYDVNGDGIITPLDALSVLKAISRRQRDVAGQSEGNTAATGTTETFWQSAAAPAIDWVSPTKRNPYCEPSREVLLF